jgi:Peptidase M66
MHFTSQLALGISKYAVFFGLFVGLGIGGCTNPSITSTVSSGGASGSSSQGGGTGAGGKTGAGGTAGSGGTSSSSSGGSGGSAGSGGTSSSGESSAAGGSGGTGGAGGSGGTAGGTAGSGGSGSGGAGGSSAGGSRAGGSGAGAGGSNADAGKADVAAADVAADRPRQDVAGSRDTVDAPPAIRCETACAAPLVCLASGQCACPNGQSLCGTECIDLNTNPSHCGTCPTVCGTGQACVGGTCTSDGCTTELANNVTLSQVAVYQAVKIPVMTAGAEVAAASRKASVVQGKETMFRMFVTLGSGWTARELSARLTLTPASGTSALYYSKKTISTLSTDADQTNSFQIYVPASAMASALRYSVQIVECGTTAGSPGAAAFPATGDIDLAVKSTGGLKVTLLPIQVGTILPDTSATALTGYTNQMMAMYPINNITFTVGTTLTAASPVDWTTMLDQVRAQRTADKPANDVYYFGLVKPADTLRTYCGSGCTTGIGFVVTSATGTSSASGRSAVGIGFGDSNSYLTMSHEIGHNHGRNHAPCSTAGTISGVDANYPYAGGLIGSWGYDARTKILIDPTKGTDIMGYCSNQWMSDYTYSGITTRVAAVNGIAMIYTPPDVLSRWRVLLVDGKGPRWGIPITDEVPPEGDAELATVYDATGTAIANLVVYRTLIADVDGSMTMIPEPQPGWYAVAVAGSAPIPFAAATP